MAKEISLEIVDERTNVNTKDITKIFKTLHGGNGGTGGLVKKIGDCEMEMKGIKTNLVWIKGLLMILIPTILGGFVKLIFFAG